MNQFKKAKQKALASGHQVENMADLQTAGVKAPIEEKKVVETPKVAVATPAPTPIPEPVAPAPVSEPLVSTPVIEETPIAETVAPVVETQPIIESQPVVEPQPIVEPEAVIEPVIVETPVITAPEPVYEEVTPVAAPQAAAPIPVPVRVTAPTPVAQEVTYAAQATAPVVSVSKPSTAKKNIPNIFAPKNEAKSMRKSLVLKPTSVKIAENYCAKNGGSFNELIQTLLDNFIDEYGL